MICPPGTRPLPRIELEDGSVEHINCDGSYEHVLSWSYHDNGWKSWVEERCSEPKCEINRRYQDYIKEAGL